MGRRYQSILKQIGVDFEKYDTCYSHTSINYRQKAMMCDKVIIATPTDTHIKQISHVRDVTQCDILCEKPIATRPIDGYDFNGVYMVNQYEYIEHKGDGQTVYDYYHSGNDGRNWDCIQLIALASGYLDIWKQGPVWACKINGHSISREQVDRAYVSMVEDFLSTKKQMWDWEFTQRAHRKAYDVTPRK